MTWKRVESKRCETNFSFVFSVKESWQNFAVKIVLKKHFVQFGAAAALFNEKLRSEFKILAQLNHPSIVEIFDVEESDEAIYTILELVDGGELFQRILSNGQIDEKTSKLIFRQIALGVEYLHENRVTHRDLKPENILLVSRENDESLIKITDFGLSKLIDERSLMKTFCGTPNYLGWKLFDAEKNFLRFFRFQRPKFCRRAAKVLTQKKSTFGVWAWFYSFVSVKNECRTRKSTNFFFSSWLPAVHAVRRNSVVRRTNHQRKLRFCRGILVRSLGIGKRFDSKNALRRSESSLFNKTSSRTSVAQRRSRKHGETRANDRSRVEPSSLVETSTFDGRSRSDGTIFL